MTHFITVDVNAIDNCIIMVQAIIKVETGQSTKGCYIYLIEDEVIRVDNTFQDIINQLKGQ
jgi:hypothetical protein